MAPVSSAGMGSTRALLSRPVVLALASYLALTVGLNAAVLAHLTTTASEGFGGDSALQMWWLAAVPHAVVHGHSPLTSDLLNAPAGVNALWNTSLVLPALLLTPITVTAGPVVSFNLLLAAAPVASALAAFAFLRRHVGPAAAILGGLVYGFNPLTTVGEPTHLFVTLTPLVPIIAILVERLLTDERPWWPAAPALGAAVAAQLLTGEEVLSLTAVAVVLVIGLLVVQRPTVALRAAPRVGGASAVALAVAGALMALPLKVQFEHRWRVRQPIHGPDFYVAALADFVRPPSRLLLHPALLPAPGGTGLSSGVHGLYLGVGVLVLLGLSTLILRRSLLGRTALLCAALLVVLSLGGIAQQGGARGSKLPWGYLEQHVPVLVNVQPLRFAILIWLCVATVVALLMDTALASERRPARRWLGGGVLAALVLLIPNPLSLGDFGPPPQTPLFFAHGARTLTTGSLVLLAPAADVHDTRAMFWQWRADFRFRMLDGYVLSAAGGDGRAVFHSPQLVARLYQDDPTTRGQPLPDDETLRAARAQLAELGVCDVIIGPSPVEARQRAMTTAMLHRTADLTDGGVAIWRLPCATSWSARSR